MKDLINNFNNNTAGWKTYISAGLILIATISSLITEDEASQLYEIVVQVVGILGVIYGRYQANK